ncbi:MAG: FMN-binding glutamate synthase family protein [Litorimonas sp.]
MPNITIIAQYGSDTIVKDAVSGLSFLSSLFLGVVGLFFLTIIIVFIIDKTQTKDSVRHNYPVLGRFRSIFTSLGEFFRQYFFAMDREEMPFNRAERDWVNHVADEGSDVVPFGSTKVLSPGTPIFANGLFPKLDSEEKPHAPLVIGPDTPHPYQPTSFFNISAMSYGSLSRPAIEALSLGASMAGCWLNTGEGGLSPFHKSGNCHIIFQLGTAKFGVRNPDATLNEEKLKKVCENPNVKMIEIKLSQGAKPGKGGILPGSKVTEEIAEIRGIPVGESALSPNRHVEASNVHELLDLIDKVRRTSGRPTGIKFVVGNITPIEDLFDEIVKRGPQSAPDFITVDSGDGGTGAAPLPLIDNMGLTIRESLPLIDDLLREKGLRDRVKLIASGKLITPADVALAFCAGTDLVNAARGFMFALGCIQALKCDKNTCPTGITTHNKRLQDGLDPANKSVRVMNYVKSMQKEVGIIAHSCGVDHPRDLGREHLLIIQPSGRSKPFDQVWDRSRYA